MEVAGRAARLREGLDAAGCDALLVTRLVNLRYLTGFTGSAGLLLVLPDELVLVTDGRYRDQSAEELAAAGVDARIEVGTTGASQRETMGAAARGRPRLGLEAESVTWGQQRRFGAEWFPGAELVPTSNLVEGLRRVKDPGEVDRMAAAAAAADAALDDVRATLAEGPTERELALALDVAMRRHGATGPSFDTIVASGPNGAKPHHRPTDRRIEAGELVVLDFGAIVDGYCSDMTRTVCVGEPPATARRMVEVVGDSQQAGVAAVRAGAEVGAVDGACRQVITDAGWGDAFLHPTGHGVGLEIHEGPRLAAGSTDTLRAGDVVTVEPGVYLPDVGGVRIEDTMVVEAQGCRVLTRSPKELVIAP
ncbi:MAG: M24 family metallopeptidase [Acidimicrobiales bacterium]